MRAYAEIDALFDTRMGAISQLDGEWAKRLLDHPEQLYFKRLRDNFKDIFPAFPQKEYEEIYAKRGMDVFFDSMPTEAITEFSKFNLTFRNGALEGMDEERLVLDLNMYPYTLSDTLKVRLREELLLATGYDEVNFVSLLPEFIVPSHLNKYTHIVMYDLNGWLMSNHAALEKHPLPGREMICPVIFNEIPKKLSEVTQIVNTAVETFRGTFTYRPQPLSRFSIFMPAMEK